LRLAYPFLSRHYLSISSKEVEAAKSLILFSNLARVPEVAGRLRTVVPKAPVTGCRVTDPEVAL